MKSAMPILAALLLLLSSGAIFADEPAKTRFWLPGSSCAFDIDLSDFSSENLDITHDGNGWHFTGEYMDRQKSLIVHLNPTFPDDNSIHIRDESVNFFKSQSAPFENFKTYEKNGIAFLSFDMVDGEGKDNFHQAHVFAFLTKGPTLLLLDFGSMNQQPVDNKLIDKIIGSTKVIDGYQPTIFENLAMGSWCYLRDDFVTAIPFYEKCLESEKQKRALPRNEWLVLVDNLGMAYGISGDTANARETFEYGLSLDPHYPMFNYNYACYFAEVGQIDSALVHLEEAYKYESNMLPDEKIPDPLTDSSFKNYWNDRRLNGLLSSFHKK